MLTLETPSDHLAYGSIQVLQHAQIIRLIHGLLQQLLLDSWQLGICNVGTDGLGVREDDCVRTDHEIWTVLGVRTDESLVYFYGFVRRGSDGVFVNIFEIRGVEIFGEGRGYDFGSKAKDLKNILAPWTARGKYDALPCEFVDSWNM
jgi:hypothetical protein